MTTSQVPSQFRNNPKLLNSLWQLLLDEIGGLRMIELLYKHHVERESLRYLADLEQLAVGTLRGRLTKAKNVLDRIGLWPEAWENNTLNQHKQANEAMDILPDLPPPHHLFSMKLTAESITEDEPEVTVNSPIFKQWVRALNLAR